MLNMLNRLKGVIPFVILAIINRRSQCDIDSY